MERERSPPMHHRYVRMLRTKITATAYFPPPDVVDLVPDVITATCTYSHAGSRGSDRLLHGGGGGGDAGGGGGTASGSGSSPGGGGGGSGERRIEGGVIMDGGPAAAGGVLPSDAPADNGVVAPWRVAHQADDGAAKKKPRIQ